MKLDALMQTEIPVMSGRSNFKGKYRILLWRPFVSYYWKWFCEILCIFKIQYKNCKYKCKKTVVL